MAKKLRKNFRKKCVDLEQTPISRRCEVNFERWRSGWLYTNNWKKIHHFDKCDRICRFCKQSDETRSHIVFECKKIDEDVRQNYLKRVASVLKCDAPITKLGAVLVTDIPVTASMYRDPTHAFVEFCQSCQYWI